MQEGEIDKTDRQDKDKDTSKHISRQTDKTHIQTHKTDRGFRMRPT